MAHLATTAKAWELILTCCVLLVFVCVQAKQSAIAEEHQGRLPLTAEQVVHNLVEMNSTRAQALHAYQGTRIYRLEYRGFPYSRNAEMVVKVKYLSPATKDFIVVSQSGSRIIIERILKRLLAAEKEALTPPNLRRTALDPTNYKFALLGYEKHASDSTYLLSVQPRSNDKFLYRGQIWVDGTDFAVVRIKAEPAKSPSVWIRQTEIEHVYGKVGDFWLPLRDHSVSQVRLGGHADLTIEYNDYKITNATELKHRLGQTGITNVVADWPTKPAWVCDAPKQRAY